MIVGRLAFYQALCVRDGAGEDHSKAKTLRLLNQVSTVLGSETIPHRSCIDNDRDYSGLVKLDEQSSIHSMAL